MKNMGVTFLAFLLLFISCREDSTITDDSAQFSFKVERDYNFIKKNVGDLNTLKMNIMPDYAFSSLDTSFSFSSDKNGVLKLNGNTLNPNTEYELISQNNIFEYIGTEQGIHNLKFIIKNSKGFSKEEIFELEYVQVPDFNFSANATSTEKDINMSDVITVVLDGGNTTQSFHVKAELMDGQGTFNIPLNTYSPFQNGTSILTFTPTSVGLVKVKLTARNNYGLEKEILINYTSSFFGFISPPFLVVQKSQSGCCLYANHATLNLQAKTRENAQITSIELEYYRRNSNSNGPSYAIVTKTFHYTPPSPQQVINLTNWFNNIADFQAGNGINLLEEKYTVTFFDTQGNSFSQIVTPNIIF